jgi:hypothetical protein
MLERISSALEYDEPRKKGVPRRLNRGVPSRYDGIGTSRLGTAPEGSSAFVPVAGRSMTTLNTPASESCANACSSTVEQECAR